MRNLIFVPAVLFIFISLIAGDGTKYGEGITLENKTPISEILSNPEDFEGKVVLVEGIVDDVCAHQGCWLTLKGEAEGEVIKVKVNDGEIIFPQEAKGKKAVVEGEVYSFDVSNDAECAGHEHSEDKACCSEKKEVKKVYQIKGIGAII